MTTRHLSFVLIGIGVLIYFYSLFGAFISDDTGQIVHNRSIQSLSNLPQFFTGSTFDLGGKLDGFFYRPLQTTYFSLLVNIFGVHPFIFHLLQLTGHIINSLLVFWIFRRWFSQLLAFFLSAVFLTHPIHVEAVAFISASGVVFSSLFGLAAIYLLMKREHTGALYFGVMSCLLTSLLFHESGILFIFISIAYKLLFRKNEWLQHVASMGVIVALYSVLRFTIAHIYLSQSSHAPIAMLPLLERMMSVPKIILFYLSTFVFPLNLGFYQIWVVRDFGWSNFYFPAITVILVLVSIGILGYQVYHRWKDQFLVFCLFFTWWIVGMALYLQIVPAELTVAERWFYIPMIGLLGILGILAQRIGSGKLRSKPVMIVAIIVLTLFSVRSFTRTLNWTNGFALYSHDIRNDPDNYNLLTNLGTEYLAQGNLDKAQELLEKSASMNTASSTLSNLGVAYYLKGDTARAKDMYQKAMQIGDYANVNINMASLLVYRGNSQEAESFIRSKLDKYPEEWGLWWLLAIAEYQQGKLDEAKQSAEKAYTLSPNDQTGYVYNQLQRNLPLNISE